MVNELYDLRKVLKEIKDVPGQYHETDVEIDPNADLAGVYRYIGAGGTVKRPTTEGPTMMFNNVKGFPNSRVLIGLQASRKRVGQILHHDYKTLGQMLNEAVLHPVAPVQVDKSQAPAQEVVHLASDPDLIFANYLPLRPTHRKMLGPISPWALCTVIVWIISRAMSPFTGWSWRIKTPSVCISCQAAGISVLFESI